MSKFNYKYILYFVFGALISFFVLKYLLPKDSEENSSLMIYEIKKLNKMIVIEEEFSSFYTYKDSSFPSFLDGYFEVDDKKIVLMVKGTSQVTYDMKKMDLELDSIRKEIHIKYIPDPEFTVYPDVKVYHFDQGYFNSFSEAEMKSIMEKAKKSVVKKQDKEEISKKAHKQLIKNLSDIYVMAKALNWNIIDDTKFSEEVKTNLKL